jgi:uncharacterized oligopeptide transporter (OPT) family protein
VAEHGISAMPAYAPIAAAIAFVIAVVLGLPAVAKYAPSPVAMGMAFILSPSISITLAIGGFARWFVARRSTRAADEEGVALASGMIGGEAFAGLLIAALLLWQR